MKKQKEFETLEEYIYWIYSNIALAHSALKSNRNEYATIDYMIRAKLYKGLCTGTMAIRSLYDDEKIKLKTNVCCYCGKQEALSLDHLVPRKKGGDDSGDNIVYACQKCNSSKNATDLIEWKIKKNEFPPILTMRRYMKLVVIYCEKQSYMNKPFADLLQLGLPFRIDLLPYDFPAPSELIL